MTQLIGYARVSTVEQNLDGQTAILETEGCETIFTDQISGKDTNRPKFQKMIDFLRKGDTVVVTKLDRLGRSVRDLLKIVEDFNAKEINLRILDIKVDTSTAAGKMVFTVMGAMAEFERNLNSERTKAGLAASPHKGGRPVTVTEDTLKDVKRDITDGLSISAACKKRGISRQSYYRLVS